MRRGPYFDGLVVAGAVRDGDSDAVLRVVARPANGTPAVFVLGNHGFWSREIRRAADRWRGMLLDDTPATLRVWRFAGGTLWG